MKSILYQSIDSENINDEVAISVQEKLRRQGKVSIPSIERIKSCRQLILCYVDSILVGTVALKVKSRTTFTQEKADLFNIDDKFHWELGYIYVDEPCRNFGIATAMVRMILMDKVSENIFATTELHPKNGMIYVIEKAGFRPYGKPWNSKLHSGTLGLFLKFSAG